MISRRLHLLRPSHARRMEAARSQARAAQRLRRAAAEEGDATLAGQGFVHVRAAIRWAVYCGCPKDLWPVELRNLLGERLSEEEI